MKFKYLGIEISGYGDIETEVRQQTIKAARAAKCLNDTIWENKYISIEANSRTYKTVIRPIMTYTTETRPDAAKTKRLLETNEMKVLQKITGKTLLDRERSDDIRQKCGVENINEKVVLYQHMKFPWQKYIYLIVSH
ncbi:uncharacterized protein LOC130892390 [Diorhabda carinulata]|uniref:uncharacterized protein LOC130892390 n=1 Tax=Diorhabda carinulata TaxID=1163345 RepID=UPI0025A005D7|nr:uncharacterized protein LOC130892390 [Diorhabda carinulata]